MPVLQVTTLLDLCVSSFENGTTGPFGPFGPFGCISSIADVLFETNVVVFFRYQ